MKWVEDYTEEDYENLRLRARKDVNQRVLDFYASMTPAVRRKIWREKYAKNREAQIRRYTKYIKRKVEQYGGWGFRHKSKEAIIRQTINKNVKSTRQRKARHKITKYQIIELMKEEERRRAENYIEENVNGDRKKILFCIVGQSGAGKTLASLHLKYKKGANVICSFTTRKPRDNEEEGRDHHFIDIVPPQEHMLAYTIFGTHKYYALKSQVQGPVTVYVIDERGLNDLRERYGDKYEIYSIYISRKRTLRIASGVDKKRAKRDSSRPHFDESKFNGHFANNGTKAALFEYIDNIYDQLLEKSKEYGW